MPMNSEAHQKITAAHLSRMAYLYVRQSTLRQVFENTESTQRQYALRDRAVALGWPLDRIVVIDSDLGQSGASAADREGFQRLVTEVSLGRVGIVLGLEVSRLARNNTDWHRLLELCALSDTLILDEDGLYDPAHFNDRLLLGLKGTMSEAELHVLKARLRGGILSRARRGELKQMVPVGFVHDARDCVILDPDAQVQAAVRLFFDTFRRTGSCLAVVKEFHAKELLFPRRLRSGAHKGELVWAELLHCRARQIIHNPRYAGAFVFGRTKHRRLPSGKYSSRQVPSEEWILLRDMHPGYITWEEYLSNLERVKGNALAWSSERHHGPAREGPALLQGLVICGRLRGAHVGALSLSSQRRDTDLLVRPSPNAPRRDRSVPDDTRRRTRCGDRRYPHRGDDAARDRSGTGRAAGTGKPSGRSRPAAPAARGAGEV